MKVLEPSQNEMKELLTQLTGEYEALKDDYTLQGARKQMLDNLITDKFDVLDIEIVNTTIKRDKFLNKAKELSSEINSLNAVDVMNEDSNDSQLDENLRMELNRGQDLLRKILEEQVAVNASIASSRKQIHELNDDALSFKENEIHKDVTNYIELKADDAKIRNVQKAHQKSEDLYSGLRYLTGVESLEVTDSTEGGVKLLITIGECHLALTLDAEKCLSHIKVIAGKSIIDVKKLLQDSRVLPCPQDLRYAVFAIGASQNAVEAVRKDLQELRKTCLVKVLSPLRFELELPNSLTAIVSIHECYPEVPGGVYIESLLGMDESPSEIDLINSAKATTNSCCFRTIPDTFQFLLGSKALGSGQ